MIELIAEPQLECHTKQYAEECGTPSVHKIILVAQGHRIEIFGGNYDYEDGGILKVVVDGEKVFDHDNDYTPLFEKYWHEHPIELKKLQENEKEYC